MVCDRCGATNTDTALLCENCGFFLQKLENLAMATPLPEQASRSEIEQRRELAQLSSSDAENSSELPIDELPTARVPSVVNPSGFAPISRLPFTTEFPSEIEQTLQQAQFSQSVSQSQAEQNEQTLQRNQPMPYFQPDPSLQTTREQGGVSQDETRPFSQAGMQPTNTWSETATSPLQAGMNMPSSLAGMYAPGQAGMAQPQAQYAGMGEQPRQAGDPRQFWQGAGNYQVPPAMPERLGNIYPGSFEPVALSASTSQGGQMPSAGLPVGGVNIFIQPLPRWIMIVGPLGCVALLADLIFANADWATGAVVAALVALILAILLGIAAGVRIALGLLQASNPRRRSQVISTALFILLLLLFSGVGISQQNGLHMAQGRYFESHQNWAAAIAQYQAAGEKPSSAVDVARTYDEWGEAQNRQQQYADAVTHFSTVLQNYQDATNEFNTAKTAIVTSYLDWADQAVQQQNYAAATAHYDALLALPFCATTCKPLAQPKDATAYYHLAEQQLSQHQYAQAVNSYQTLTTRFPSAPEAGQVHMHYAQALWGKGQQEVNTACSDALSNYRLLARLFADTSQGKQAATALTQPVAVKGHFTQTIPGAPFHPTAYLVQGLVVGIQQEQFPSLLTRAPAAPIHSDGTFTFTSVPQGSYELIWSSDNTLHFYYAFSGQHILYTANLGPLCTYNYGDINQAIPTSAQ